MHLPAPLHVTVLVRALDVGPKLERVWRLSCAVGEDGVRLRRALPFEAGRPVRVELTLPDQDETVAATGVVTEVRPDEHDDDVAEAQEDAGAGEDADRPRPRAVAFTALEPLAKQRLAKYIEERMLSA